MRFRHYVLVVFLLLSGATAFAQSWVDSFGLHSDYALPRYLTGYGYSDLADHAERIQTARNTALADLARTVQTRITSTEDIRTYADEHTERTRYVNATQTATDLRVSGVRYEIEERGNGTHALAWIEVQELRRQYLEQARDTESRLQALLGALEEMLALGSTDRAGRHLHDADAALTVLFDNVTVIRALDALASPRHSSTNSVQMAEPYPDPRLFVRAVRDAERQLALFRPATVEQAATLLARRLAEQHCGRFQVMPLLYEDSDFSSAFGNRFSGVIEASVPAEANHRNQSHNVTSSDAIVRGSYWVDEETIEVQVTARSVQHGQIVASARTTVPVSSVRPDTLYPANLESALAAGSELLNDQIVSGGINVEVWTDRGRHERSLVFEEGEPVQFYFRVNQPAFLQLSYVLATGQTILLEEQFYIGMDRVNRVVALPYRFEVVPPFGVERLIVTAHSGIPPRPNVSPQRIAGQWYEVFGTPGDAVARTRGLVRERSPEREGTDSSTWQRVGEAHVTITTVAQAQE
ncbi:MAG: hypothetical protein EA383_13740 [Spirochaetaceae bacterium]|nr:MAG: hypothetical protein EA383_13740 [Spirochaetaceae bacterium]